MPSVKIQFNCVKKGTLVNTPFGYTKVEDINVGDKICTLAGSEPVKSIEHHKSIQLFKVSFSDGGEQFVTIGHRYNVIRNKVITQVRLDEVAIGDFVQVHSCELDPTAEDTTFDYFDGLRCGILLGDGTITKEKLYGVSVNKDELDYINELRKVFDFNFGKLHESKISKSAYLQLNIPYSEKLARRYKLSAVEGHNKTIPKDLLKSKNCIIGIIDGLIATDGCIKKNTIAITTTSHNLALDIRRALLYLGIHGRIYSSLKNDGGSINGRKIIRKYPRHDVYISYSDLDRYSKLSKLHQIHKVKWDKLLSNVNEDIREGSTWRAKILSIVPAGNDEAYDLYCEQSDTWITDGYVQQGCGEFLPGKIRVGDKIVPPPVVNKIPKYPVCCNEIPGRPSIPRPPLDEWVCVCGAACADDPSQCLEGRGCIKKRNVPPGTRHGRVFDTFQDCVTFGFSEAPCWKCGVKCTETTVPCPPPRPDLPRQIIRQCVACPPAREQTGPCAQYPSLRECAIYCKTENRNCPGGPITPVIIRPPDIVPIVRPITPVVVRGPITPTPYYKCVSRIEYCSPPFQSIPKRLRQGCELCWTDLGNGTGRLPDGSIGPRPNDCNLTSQQCATRGGANETPCRDVIYNQCPIAGPITPVIVEPPRPPIAISITPISVTPQDPPRVIAIGDGIAGVDDGGSNRQREGTGSQILSLLAGNNTLLGQTVDLSVGVTRNQLFEESRKVRTIEVSREVKKKFVSSSTKDTDSIYHERYNLFQYNPENTTKLVTNTKWLNIFKPVVPEEVAYILNVAGTTNTWNEYAYTQLTKEKVLVSLRYELLRALSNLHFANGKVINVDHFVETIRFLMTTNRLHEFDDSYFTNLYVKQRNDEYLEINDFGTQGLKEQAALGLISSEATNSDPFQQDDEISKVLLLRSKRLNTDIEANIPIERFNGVVQPVPIQDAGLEVVALLDQGLPVVDGITQTTSYVQYGPGHGYYFSATLEDGSIVPLITDNQLSSTYYLSPALRDTTLELLGKDSAIRFVAEAISGLGEFESYTTGTPLVPMYMKLRLNSLGDMERSNPLVREVSGIYDLIDSPETINDHLREYGFNVSKVFVDFDDPFLRYVQDSEAVTFYQSDISFDGMYPNKANAGNSILSRNIAFAVIFVPVRGSKFNPFGGRSKLINYTSPYSRELQVINDINSTTNQELYTSVKQDLLIEKEGVYKIGLLETNNAQNVSFTYQTSGFDYSGLYFSGSSYISEQPTKSLPITNRLVNQVIETNISGIYGLSGITWWDIYRRLTADEMAKISFEIPKIYLDKLANGLRGYKIKYVLQRDNVTEGSMLGDTIDSVIIETTDRNANSQNII